MNGTSPNVFTFPRHLGPDHVQVNCRMKVNCRKVFVLVCQLFVDQARPNFFLQLTFRLQFTFSCNSLVHDPALKVYIDNIINQFRKSKELSIFNFSCFIKLCLSIYLSKKSTLWKNSITRTLKINRTFWHTSLVWTWRDTFCPGEGILHCCDIWCLQKLSYLYIHIFVQ